MRKMPAGFSFLKLRLTMRAAEVWESPRFQAWFWLKVGSVKMALSRPTTLR